MVYHANATGYHKQAKGDTSYNHKLEGGNRDRVGRELYSMEDYFAGRGGYVAVAIDATPAMARQFPYGTKIKIQFSDETRAALAKRYGVPVERIDSIEFRLVDTGSAFTNRGTGRLDICSGYSNRTDSAVTGRIQWEVIGGPDASGLRQFSGGTQGGGSRLTVSGDSKRTVFSMDTLITFGRFLFQQSDPKPEDPKPAAKAKESDPQNLETTKLRVSGTDVPRIDAVRKDNGREKAPKSTSAGVPEASHAPKRKTLEDVLLEQAAVKR